MAVKVLINLTHAGDPVWFQFDGSGTIADPAKYDASASGGTEPVSLTNAGGSSITFFRFFGAGTSGDPYTL